MTANASPPGQEANSDILAAFVRGLDLHPGSGETATIRVPIAVVIAKADACNLAAVIGDAAIAAICRARRIIRSARNRFLRQQLMDWGEAGFVSQLDARFARVAYFAASAYR